MAFRSKLEVKYGPVDEPRSVSIEELRERAEHRKLMDQQCEELFGKSDSNLMSALFRSKCYCFQLKKK